MDTVKTRPRVCATRTQTGTGRIAIAAVLEPTTFLVLEMECATQRLKSARATVATTPPAASSNALRQPMVSVILTEPVPTVQAEVVCAPATQATSGTRANSHVPDLSRSGPQPKCATRTEHVTHVTEPVIVIPTTVGRLVKSSAPRRPKEHATPTARAMKPGCVSVKEQG